MSSETVGQIGFLAIVIALSGTLGWMLNEMRHAGRRMDAGVDASIQRSSQEEVELFTTAMPDSFQPGKIVGNYGQGSTRYAVTRVEDLGSFTDVRGQSHQRWRVYGRPA